MPKTKTGEQISWKEFFSRWKKGIKNLTPIQKTTNEVMSTFVMSMGYTAGLISLIIFRDLFVVPWFTYALIIIFLGASWSNIIRCIALFQQLKIMKRIDKDIDEVSIGNLFDDEVLEVQGDIKC